MKLEIFLGPKSKKNKKSRISYKLTFYNSEPLGSVFISIEYIYKMTASFITKMILKSKLITLCHV